MFELPPALARLRDPSSVPPPQSAEAQALLARLADLEAAFLGVEGQGVSDIAHRLDIISEERQRAAIMTESGQHYMLARRMASFDPIAFVGTDRPALPPWQRPLLIVQADVGPAVQVFSTAVSAVTAFRTGHGLVPQLLGWQQRAHFGLLILRDTVLAWSAEQQTEVVLTGGEATELLESLMPNIQAQIDALEAQPDS